MAQECCLAEDGPLAKRQELHNPEFLAGQRKLLAVDKRKMAVQVDFQVSDGNGGRAVAVGAPDDGVEVCQQLEPVERLGQIPVCTCAKRGDLVVGARISGDDEDRHRHVILANQACQSGAVAVGKVNVEQHRVDGVVFQLGKRRLDVVRRRLEMSRLFKGHAQNVSYDRIVFYNQDMHGLSSHITFEQFKPDSGDGFPRVRTFEKPALIDKQTVIYLVQSLNSHMRD